MTKEEIEHILKEYIKNKFTTMLSYYCKYDNVILEEGNNYFVTCTLPLNYFYACPKQLSDIVMEIRRMNLVLNDPFQIYYQRMKINETNEYFTPGKVKIIYNSDKDPELILGYARILNFLV